MWREALRIGVDKIDEQHKTLFETTEALLKSIRTDGVDPRQECAPVILFLKKYALRHFSDEEAYQESIDCAGIEDHKLLHEEFVQTVLYHEKKLVDSDFAEKDVNEFTGMLIAWLLYHVAGADQRIGKEPEDAERLSHYTELVSRSVGDVMNKVANHDRESVSVVESHNETFADSFFVEVGLAGDITGSIIFGYPISLINNLVFSMMGYAPDKIGDLEFAILTEVSEIAGRLICDGLSEKRKPVFDVTSTVITNRPEGGQIERIALKTAAGIMEVDLAVTLTDRFSRLYAKKRD